MKNTMVLAALVISVVSVSTVFGGPSSRMHVPLPELPSSALSGSLGDNSQTSDDTQDTVCVKFFAQKYNDLVALVSKNMTRVTTVSRWHAVCLQGILGIKRLYAEKLNQLNYQAPPAFWYEIRLLEDQLISATKVRYSLALPKNFSGSEQEHISLWFSAFKQSCRVLVDLIRQLDASYRSASASTGLSLEAL
ncbi:hypothetical protein K2W90_04035 [Candidatus Babeliales bacterium]|nr:hypothetical protein [Candidatus Babeliales bacterium]